MPFRHLILTWCLRNPTCPDLGSTWFCSCGCRHWSSHVSTTPVLQVKMQRWREMDAPLLQGCHLRKEGGKPRLELLECIAVLDFP